jgi:hypothetical protein
MSTGLFKVKCKTIAAAKAGGKVFHKITVGYLLSKQAIYKGDPDE